MSNTLTESIRRIVKLGLLCLLALSLGSPTTRAGLSLTIDLYATVRGKRTFFTPRWQPMPWPRCGSGTYVISSPGWPTNGARRGFQMTTNGLADRTEFDYENSYGGFNSAMQQLTNGTWTILFTNATTTNLYTFTLSAPTMTSNMLPATIITFPSNGALNVPNQPTFAWQGPTNWPVTTANTYFYNYDFSFFQYPAPIPATQTTWTEPAPFPNGLNCTFNLDYATNYATSVFVATTPLSTNAGHAAISGWASATILETGDSVSFAVTNPPAVGTTLVAHYTFDNSGNLGQDSSGHGYDLNFNGGVTSSGTAKAGSGAASFDGGSFFGYTTTPGNILSTLAGDFSLSFWIKTTQNDGNENGLGWNGAGWCWRMCRASITTSSPPPLTEARSALIPGLMTTPSTRQWISIMAPTITSQSPGMEPRAKSGFILMAPE